MQSLCWRKMMGLPIVLFLTFLALGVQGCETDRRQCYQATTTLAPPSTSERDAILLARCRKFCLERVRDCSAATDYNTVTVGFSSLHVYVLVVTLFYGAILYLSMVQCCFG